MTAAFVPRPEIIVFTRTKIVHHHVTKDPSAPYFRHHKIVLSHFNNALTRQVTSIDDSLIGWFGTKSIRHSSCHGMSMCDNTASYNHGLVRLSLWSWFFRTPLYIVLSTPPWFMLIMARPSTSCLSCPISFLKVPVSTEEHRQSLMETPS